jgi:phosphoribosyl-ATP pyrophosphohydrolase/phosphoribosyl-AMP cyclohydrolase
LATEKVNFFSPAKNVCGQKGEESGNFLKPCVHYTRLRQRNIACESPSTGPVCHTGNDTCWGEINQGDFSFINYLQNFIKKRYQEMPEGSYTTSLFKSGVNRMAQKVGEEAVETVIEAVNGTDEGFIYEASDLIYHLIVLLTSKGYSLDDIGKELKRRHK